MASWIALWTGLGAFFSLQTVLRILPGGVPPVSWAEALTTNLSYFWLWCVLGMPVAMLCERRPILGERRVRHLVLHLIACAVLVPTHVALFELLRDVVNIGFWTDASFSERFVIGLRNSGYFNLLIYGGVVLVTHLRRSELDNRERSVVAARLHEQLARAELGALRMQLHPHFLFNALNSIAALLHRDPEQAESMVIQLSRLLRRALETRDTHEVPLSREIELTRNYLELAALRHGERLRYEIDVPSALGAAMVPTFLLQPVTENAVVHGVDGSEGGNWIIVRARQAGSDLQLEVENNVPAARQTRTRQGGGVGLENVRARLRHLYGERASFELEIDPGRRALARIVLPYRESNEGVPN